MVYSPKTKRIPSGGSGRGKIGHITSVDIQFLFSRQGLLGQGVPINPLKLPEVVPTISKEIRKTLNEIGKASIDELKELYAKAPKNRMPHGRGIDLTEAIQIALFHKVSTKQAGEGIDFEVNAFNFAIVRTLTSGPQWGLRQGKSVFDLFELESGGKRRHHSTKYGFISLAAARILARAAARFAGMSDSDRAEFLQDMEEAFQGRHGGLVPPDKAGIMVNLKKPLFFRVPAFGLAEDFTDPHPGFVPWNVLKNYPGPLKYNAKAGNADWLGKAMNPAFDRAATAIESL